jgi:DNA-binding NarL/FixJ family response regulator
VTWRTAIMPRMPPMGRPSLHERRERFFDEHGVRVGELYRQLGTLAAVCAVFPDVPVSLVQEAVHRTVGDLKPHRSTVRARAANSERNEEIVRLYQQGESMAAIGRRYGLSGQRVREILRRSSS